MSKAKQNTVLRTTGLKMKSLYSEGSCRNGSLTQAKCMIYTQQNHLGNEVCRFRNGHLQDASNSTFKCQSIEELRLGMREETLVVAPEHRPKAFTNSLEGEVKGHFSLPLSHSL